MSNESKKPFLDKIGLANLLNLDEIVAQDGARRQEKAEKKTDQKEK